MWRPCLKICKVGFERNLPLEGPNTPCHCQSNQSKYLKVLNGNEVKGLWWPYLKSDDADDFMKGVLHPYAPKDSEIFKAHGQNIQNLLSEETGQTDGWTDRRTAW